MLPPPTQGLRHQVTAAGWPNAEKPRRRRTRYRRQAGRAAGAGAGIGPPRGARGLWALLEAVGGPDSPPQGTRQEEEGRDPHLPPRRDRHRGRQEKVCLTRASSGSGPWASRGVRGTRRCRVPSEAEDCGAGEAAEVAEPCRQRLHSGSSKRISSSSRNGLSPKRSSSCRRSWGGDVGVRSVPGRRPGPLPDP